MTPLLLQGTAQRLSLADNSINTIITSPPYFGLRSYQGLPPEAWRGGAFVAVPGVSPIVIPGPETWEELEACAHAWGEQPSRAAKHATTPSASLHHPGYVNAFRNGTAYVNNREGTGQSAGAWCQHCGCWCGTLGSEPTIELYLWHMALVLRELYRVLREDGTLYLNLGDSYATNIHTGSYGLNADYHSLNGLRGKRASDVPQGNLLGIPWRVALAAQAEGWILRRDVVWEKVSPMPESVRGWAFQGETCPCVEYPDQKPALVLEQGTTRLSSHVGVENNPTGLALPACPACHGIGRLDTVTLRRGSWRHTASHEMVFMLVKQMGYYANSEAVREQNEGDGRKRGNGAKHVLGDGLSKPNGWAPMEVGGRNPRDVIRPAPSPFSGAHFAVFPPSLPEQFLRASCPERVCTACGEPWAVSVAYPASYPSGSYHDHAGDGTLYGKYQQGRGPASLRPDQMPVAGPLRRTCSCPCDTPWRPGICLDPFAGTGTVSLVARALGRHSIGVEASPAYLKLARERLSLNLLDAWAGKPMPACVETYDDLPLFT